MLVPRGTVSRLSKDDPKNNCRVQKSRKFARRRAAAS
jgi:hypothetical protein